MQRSSGNSRLFWPVLIGVTAIDAATKLWAQSELQPQRMPHTIFGDLVRFTLVYNPGAAFGLHVGQYSRWVFMVLTLIALVILGRLYRATRSGDAARVFSLALVCGGALGNLADRVHSGLGVVDFIDVGLADARWPTFNVADMAVSIGAFLLAWVLWGEESEVENLGVASSSPHAAPSSQEIS